MQESTLLGDPVLNGYVDALSDAMTRQHAYPVSISRHISRRLLALRRDDTRACVPGVRRVYISAYISAIMSSPPLTGVRGGGASQRAPRAARPFVIRRHLPRAA